MQEALSKFENKTPRATHTSTATTSKPATTTATTTIASTATATTTTTTTTTATSPASTASSSSSSSSSSTSGASSAAAVTVSESLFFLLRTAAARWRWWRGCEREEIESAGRCCDALLVASGCLTGAQRTARACADNGRFCWRVLSPRVSLRACNAPRDSVCARNIADH